MSFINILLKIIFIFLYILYNIFLKISTKQLFDREKKICYTIYRYRLEVDYSLLKLDYSLDKPEERNELVKKFIEENPEPNEKYL